MVEDSAGIAERMDREIAASKAVYKDPWAEAFAAPVAENQYSSLLKVLA